MSNEELRKELIEFLEWFWSQNKVSIFEMDDIMVDTYISWRKPNSMLSKEPNAKASVATDDHSSNKS